MYVRQISGELMLIFTIILPWEKKVKLAYILSIKCSIYTDERFDKNSIICCILSDNTVYACIFL